MHTPDSSTRPRQALVTLLFGAVAVAWGFYPTFAFLVQKWIDEPQYSHGFLVPIFSGYLLHRKWKAGQLIVGTPYPLLGLILLMAASALHALAGGWMNYQVDAVALLIAIAALTIAAGGRALFSGCAAAIGFLVFMVPLPYELEQNVGGPLKKFATNATTYLLQTIGQPAIAEGNKILIDDVTLGVVDACSGLKMLVTFSAFGVGAVLTLGRTRFENALIVLGIVPIAVLTNVLRITATGVAYTLTSDKALLDFLHDFHGWLMMPLGLGLLGLQLWCLSRLVEPADARPTVAGLRFA